MSTPVIEAEVVARERLSSQAPAERILWLEVENARVRARVHWLEGDKKRTDRIIEKLEARVGELLRSIEELRRAAKRQAAPHSKNNPEPDPKRPGRKAGKAYGAKAYRPAPERVRGLAGVATLYSFVAATTASDFDFEAPRVDAHLEILLPLVFDALESSFATAARAATWQLDRDRLVDALGSRAVRLCPIRLARLASWPLGIWLGVVLGVGGGLTLGGAPQLLDAPEQLADARFELLDNPIGALLIALEPVNARPQPRVLDLEPQDPLGGRLRGEPLPGHHLGFDNKS